MGPHNTLGWGSDLCPHQATFTLVYILCQCVEFYVFRCLISRLWIAIHVARPNSNLLLPHLVSDPYNYSIPLAFVMSVVRL